MRQRVRQPRPTHPQQRATWYLLRREPFYHKMHYSKTPKYDASAAVLGVVTGAFVAYLTLSTFGSGGPDLTDLTCLVWYAGLGFVGLHLWRGVARAGYRACGLGAWARFLGAALHALRAW